jgi:hypothetical protein
MSTGGVLFVPVSGAVGTGEFQRCLMLAQALAARGVTKLRFVISADAPYADNLPFPARRVAGTTTSAHREVAAEIRDWRPRVVVFDGGGRASAWRAARAAGSSVVFVSSRPSARRRGFRWRRLLALDQHWHVAPSASTTPLNLLERFKLYCRPRVEFVRHDVWFEAVEPAAELRRAHALQDRRYVLFVAGGGTQRIGAGDADALLDAAASRFAGNGTVAVVVGGSASGWQDELYRAGRLRNAELMALVEGAEVVICGGGQLLVQCAALGRPTIACALQEEQRPRVAAFARAGATLEVDARADALADAALRLVVSADLRAQTIAAAQRLALRNGLPDATDRLVKLLNAAEPG